MHFVKLIFFTLFICQTWANIDSDTTNLMLKNVPSHGDNNLEPFLDTNLMSKNVPNYMDNNPEPFLGTNLMSKNVPDHVPSIVDSNPELQLDILTKLRQVLYPFMDQEFNPDVSKVIKMVVGPSYGDNSGYTFNDSVILSANLLFNEIVECFRVVGNFVIKYPFKLLFPAGGTNL